MSGPYFDVYALCPERSLAAARRFLDEWAPGRTLSTDDQDEGALAKMETGVWYWRSGRTDAVEHVILAFTDDGAMIAGLSVGGGWEQPRERIAKLLDARLASVGADQGYVTTEEPPATSRAEIIARANT